MSTVFLPTLPVSCFGGQEYFLKGCPGGPTHYDKHRSLQIDLLNQNFSQIMVSSIMFRGFIPFLSANSTILSAIL